MHDDHEISNRLLNTSLFSSPPSIRTSSSSNPQNKEQEEEDRKPVVPLNRPTALDERQVTIILLLAQVCAIYDPTPKTFVLNVARFHELGLIDSVGFLSDLGLMHSTIESPRTTATTDLKPKGVGPYDFSSHEMLMISRYQREFFELRGIGRGTFGQVVMATNQFDQTVYAVKKIRFQNKGFGNPWIQKIVREVQCLAKCDHVNVNRYYSAWLEPTWLLQSAQTATTTTMEEEEDNVESHRFSEINVQAPRHRHLLQEIHHLVEIEQGESISMDHTEQQYDDSTFDNLSSSIRFESLDAHQLATSTSSSSSKKPVTYQLTLYIQMALCQQRTLRDWIDERNQNILRDATLTLDQERNLIFFRQLCSGLAHVHAQGIIHRDLKPSNVFLSQDGQTLKIGDFGLSKLLKNIQTVPSSPTTTTTPQESTALVSVPPQQRSTSPSMLAETTGIGTVGYASPEQLQQESESTHVDQAADSYSLGMILLELFQPFQTKMERARAFDQIRQYSNSKSEKHLLPKEFLSDFPEMAKIVAQLIEFDPQKRPSASMLLNEQDYPELNPHFSHVSALQHALKEKNKIIQEQAALIERLLEEK